MKIGAKFKEIGGYKDEMDNLDSNSDPGCITLGILRAYSDGRYIGPDVRKRTRERVIYKVVSPRSDARPVPF